MIRPNGSECNFAQPSINYLGHIISANPIQKKTRAIQDWPPPQSLSTLHRFLDLTGFNCCFIWHYTSPVSLTDMLCSSSTFVWSLDTCFCKLKNAITTTPVLMLPNFELPFEIKIDAFRVAIGVVLTQNGHPLALLNKKNNNNMQQNTISDVCYHEICRKLDAVFSGASIQDYHIQIKRI